MKEKQPYYIGLDCGTSSVGWAVTDKDYRLLKGKHRIKSDKGVKTKKQTLWGFRLFDEADTAAERRTYRSARRRGERAKNRLKLLRMLFNDEIFKVDPEFYQRLKESFYYKEDKKLKKNSKNTLFNDPDFTDKDFHAKYPTIWHLRRAIIKADEDESFDIRLYFLAIQHILKHRGHFLYEGNLKNGKGDFSEIFAEFCDTAENYGLKIEPSSQESVEKVILSDSTITDKKKKLKEIALFLEQEDTEDEDPKMLLQRQKCLCDLIVGGNVDLAKLFELETEDKYSYSLSNLDEKEAEIAEKIGLDNMPLLIAAKKIYDYGILDKLLGDSNFISEAMVASYDQHKKDLEELKAIFEPHKEIYQQLFQDNKYDKKNNKFDVAKNPSYYVYAGHAYQKEGDRKGHILVSQEDFNRHLKKCLEEVGYNGNSLTRAEKGELLPKQRGQAKGTIPMQLHANELEKILEKLQRDFPSFAEEDPSEDDDYNTKAKKIAKIHEFRIPYYCGPIVKRKFDDNRNPVVNGKSEFSWADEEITQLVYPWNFDKLINKNQRAKNFIRRMTNECTYLIGEDVLPKCSLVYQKYMVLNELNNLKINGHRIDNELKQKIFERGYKNGELKGNITLKKLEKWCKENGYIAGGDELNGTSEVKILPKYQTYQDFSRILGVDFEKKYPADKLEKVVELITILGDEKSMLKRSIKVELECDDRTAELLSKLSYKDWGRMSARFLNGITVNNHTILDWLWEDNKNLMELMGQEVGFKKVADEFNVPKNPNKGKISFSDVKNLYCSPAVKRSVWQTIKIVNELVKNLGHAPEKIFLEVTRGEDEKAKGKYTLARKKDLETKLKAIRTEDVREILKELDEYDDRQLQSKKLFLYFSQMGKCAYSGEPINLEEFNNTALYDIDHIYPRSKTKDDSITRNLVLVKASLNREKTNTYPISDSIRSEMHGIWKAWYQAGLITAEKYERLIRATPLTDDELGGFIARQLVGTSQSVKAIHDLLKRAYPDTKIIMVKAGQVSDFRHLMSIDKKDRDGNVYEPGRYEFIKVRDINDLHHAKDAYLNIVVGNVINSTFTDNPAKWIKDRNGREYSIRPEIIFRCSQKYQKADGKETVCPEVKGWNFAESIKIISDAMKRNDVIWTRMNYIESKEISDLQLVGKGKSSDGLLRIKQQKRLDPKKYGGYNSLKGAHFALIECKDKKGNTERRIIQIPIVAKNNIEKYVTGNYKEAEVILPVIKYKSLLKINGFPLHLAGKTSTGLVLYNAKQIIFDENINRYIKSVLNVVNKDKQKREGYKINEAKDNISKAKNANLMNQIGDKMLIFTKMPSFSEKAEEIKKSVPKIADLDIKTQCSVISNMLKVTKCSADTGDISILVLKSSNLGKPTMPEDIVPRYNETLLINQSPTGLYEEIIDLKTVQPKTSKQGKK